MAAMSGYPREPTEDDANVAGRRLGARLLDVAFIIGAYELVEAATGGEELIGPKFNALAPLPAALTLLLFLGIFVVFPFFLEGLWDGQSPGKWCLGIKVVQTDGAPCTIGASVLRNLLLLADWLPALYLGAVVSMAISSRKQRLGDRLADTVVVRRRPEQSEDDLRPEAAGETRQDIEVRPP